MNKYLLRGVIGIALFSFATIAAGAEKVPISDFFTHNIYLQPTLSPSGRYVSIVTWDPKVPERNLLVIDDLKSHSIWRTFAMTFTAGKGSIYHQWGGQELFWDVRWLTDHLIVFGSAENYGALGHPFLTGKIYSLDLDKQQRRLLQGPGEMNRQGFQILRTLANDPKHIVTASHSYARGTAAFSNLSPSAFLLNTHGVLSYAAATDWGKGTTANGHRIMTSPLQNGGLMADRQGEVRLAVGFDEGSGDTVAEFRDSADSKWRSVPAKFLDRLGTQFVDFIPGGNDIYMLDYAANNAQTLSLYRLNPDTGKKALLYSNPQVGIDSTDFHDGLIWGPKHEHVVAVETMYGRPQLSLLQSHGPAAKVLSAFSQSFPGEYPRIMSWSRDGSLAIVAVSSDRDPGRFLLVNVKTMHAQPLFKQRPDINPTDMAPMRPIEFKARDGLLIHGYLTLPNGEAPKNLPMIVYVHGGPHGVRDQWGFDPWVQLLANRGYAVLQINYRGSMGYGYKYMESGYGHWGTTMQYDVIDGTRWAVKQGYANPHRICIFGGSYGGFAALRSAEIAPDLYQCTVGYDGVYDLNMMFDKGDVKNTSNGRLYMQNVLGTDAADRAKQSPVNHVSRLKGGIFLIEGGQDHRAPPAQVDELKQRLNAAGKKYIYLYKEYEGHGFGKVSNQRELAKKLLAFFDHWIGPQSGQQVAAAAR